MLWELIYASLFHDIGKVYHRAFRRGSHSRLSGEFISRYKAVFEGVGVDPTLIGELVREHHGKGDRLSDEHRRLLDCLKKADWCSAAERALGEELLERESKALIELLVSPLWIKDYTLRSRKEPLDEFLRNKYYTRDGKYYCKDETCYKPYPLTFPSPKVIGKIDEEITKYIVALGGDEPVATADELNMLYNERIRRELEEFMDLIRRYTEIGILSPQTLYITLTSYLRPLLLYVPDAIYGVKIPSTNLYGHLVGTASLATAYYFSESFRIIRLDISGIQAFIKRIGSHKGALRQIRGRSLLLQLLMKAIVGHMLREIQLPYSVVIADRGDTVDFIIPDNSDLIRRIKDMYDRVAKYILKIFHNDIYVSIGFSEAVKECIYCEPWDPLYLFKNSFAKALDEVEKNLSVNKLRRHVIEVSKVRGASDDIDYVECRMCRIVLPKNYEYIVDLSREEFNDFKSEVLRIDKDTKYLCLPCFYSQVLGKVSENLTLIIRVYSKQYTEKVWNEIMNDPNKAIIKEPIGSYGVSIDIGRISFNELNTTFIIVSLRQESSVEGGIAEVDERAVIDTIIQYVLGELANELTEGDEIIVYRINDLKNMLIRKIDLLEGVLKELARKNIKLGFSYIFTNFTLGRERTDIDGLAKISGDRKTLIGWARTDIDNTGKMLKILSGSLGRYITIIELINFITGYIAQSILYDDSPFRNAGKIADYVVAVFTGGDDSFVIGRFPEVFKYIARYHDMFARIIGKLDNKPLLTMSAGIYLSEPKYPAYLGYVDSLRKLKIAKDESKNRIAIPTIPYVEISNDNIKAENTIPWSFYDKIFTQLLYATKQDLYENKVKLLDLISNNKTLFYKIYSIIYSLINITSEYLRRNASLTDPAILKYLVSYTYYYNRHKNKLDELDKCVKEVLKDKEKDVSIKPQFIVSRQNIEDALAILNKLGILLSIVLLHVREGINIK